MASAVTRTDMAYQHDIFVSYRRDPEALVWIDRFLKPILRHRVGMELQRKVDIYVHEVGDQIQAGTAWPVDLGQTIACSRVLIALWSGDYLASEWCRHELSLMLHRERVTKARSVRNKYGLVIPVIVHDGDTIPKSLASAQRLELKDCFISRMPDNGPVAEQMVKQIALHAQGIAAAIHAAPPWKSGWPTKAAAKLLNAFKVQQKSQRKLPRFSQS
jgi:hypothetical protein